MILSTRGVRVIAIRVRLADIAEEARVSVCTVSRVLNNTYLNKVSDATRHRVLDAAKKLNYRPNLNARALVGQKTFIIGVIVVDLVGSFMSEVVQAVQSAAEEDDYSLLIYSTQADPKREEKYLRILQSKGADGILYTPGSCFDLVNKLYASGLPIVQMCNAMPQLKFPFVDVDHEQGAFKAVTHLFELGHRRIGHLSGLWPTDSHGAKRAYGYRHALTEFDVPIDPDLELYTGYTFEGGYEGMQRLLDLPDRPTAVFACSDMTAWGAMRAAKERGLSIPGDVSIIGFDDLSIAGYFDVPLTTMGQPKGQIGRTAYGKLSRMIHNKPTESSVIAPEFVMRDSVSAIVS